MLTPESRGSFKSQLLETLSALEAVLGRAASKTKVTSQTVFLRDASTLEQCEQLLSDQCASDRPVTSFVLQPPCSGAALALEAWAIQGDDVRVERHGPRILSVSYDGLRWVYCSGIRSRRTQRGVYHQSTDALEQMQSALFQGASGFENVLRTWFYLGGITQDAEGLQCYKEFNRARADFYQKVRFKCLHPLPNIPHGIYPASTGIGMDGTDLVASCLALHTDRNDAFLLPLENPQQTPAYAYHPKYSPQSPKFSRAKALILGNYITTWISGTASVVHSESRHPGDVERQTHQTIDNIEQLLTPDNFAFHGIRGAGAGLKDLAKIRVYLKRAEDYPACKAICERRLGPVPAIYALAEICRPELLVEIEGVAFSRCTRC